MQPFSVGLVAWRVPHVMKLIPTTLDATHIFDGLNEFPTHVTHMRFGNFVMDATPWPLPPSIVPQMGSSERAPDGTLFQIALQWLREDRKDRQELEKAGRKTRGARRGQVWKRYDHWRRTHDSGVPF